MEEQESKIRKDKEQAVFVASLLTNLYPLLRR